MLKHSRSPIECHVYVGVQLRTQYTNADKTSKLRIYLQRCGNSVIRKHCERFNIGEQPQTLTLIRAPDVRHKYLRAFVEEHLPSLEDAVVTEACTGGKVGQLIGCCIHAVYMQ